MVDINSKFEFEPGKKDIKKIEEFLKHNMINYNVDKKGFYGDFGGAFVPEMFIPI